MPCSRCVCFSLLFKTISYYSKVSLFQTVFVVGPSLSFFLKPFILPTYPLSFNAVFFLNHSCFFICLLTYLCCLFLHFCFLFVPIYVSFFISFLFLTIYFGSNDCSSSLPLKRKEKKRKKGIKKQRRNTKKGKNRKGTIRKEKK